MTEKHRPYGRLKIRVTPNGAIETIEPTDQWSVLVHAWFPMDIEPPYPVIIYGHGLNSNAETARAVANIVTPPGFAVFSIDALHHGQHPTANPDNALPALIFLGICAYSWALCLEARGVFLKGIHMNLSLFPKS